jgi:hypothetical protein
VSTTIKSNYAQPAFIGGLVMGVLSALPLVNVGNACCCLWVVSGGVVAAYVFQQNQQTPMTPGDGALVGLLAGLIGALVQVVVSLPLDLLVGPMYRELAQRAVEMAGSMPPELRDVLDRISRRGAPTVAFFVLSKVVSAMVWGFLGAIFSTIGGLLGAVMFKKNLPPGVIDVPPQS